MTSENLEYPKLEFSVVNWTGHNGKRTLRYGTTPVSCNLVYADVPPPAPAPSRTRKRGRPASNNSTKDMSQAQLYISPPRKRGRPPTKVKLNFFKLKKMKNSLKIESQKKNDISQTDDDDIVEIPVDHVNANGNAVSQIEHRENSVEIVSPVKSKLKEKHVLRDNSPISPGNAVGDTPRPKRKIKAPVRYLRKSVGPDEELDGSSSSSSSGSSDDSNYGSDKSSSDEEDAEGQDGEIVNKRRSSLTKKGTPRIRKAAEIAPERNFMICEICSQRVVGRCNKRTSKTMLLLTHAKCHTKKRQFRCSGCYYTTNNHIQRHIRNVHNGNAKAIDQINDGLRRLFRDLAIKCFPSMTDELASWYVGSSDEHNIGLVRRGRRYARKKHLKELSIKDENSSESREGSASQNPSTVCDGDEEDGDYASDDE